MKKLTQREIIKRLNKIHNNKYSYVFPNNYKNVKSKIKIICPIHGEFEQIVDDHLKGRECSTCGANKSIKNRRSNLSNLIDRSNIEHNNKYDYSLIKSHKSMNDRVEIICPEHGSFFTTLHWHINKGRGCKQCAIDKITDTKDGFIEKSRNVHGDKYNYDKVNYVTSRIKVIITCPKHGDFEQKPNEHIYSKNGCPVCKESKGEREVRNILKKNGIDFEYQKSFCDLKMVNCLSFDFYLPEYDMCIEYDGEQHFRPVDYWGGKEGFEKRKLYDKEKNDYCKLNNINLIRISYKDNIKIILKRHFQINERIKSFKNFQ